MNASPKFSTYLSTIKISTIARSVESFAIVYSAKIPPLRHRTNIMAVPRLTDALIHPDGMSSKDVRNYAANANSLLLAFKFKFRFYEAEPSVCLHFVSVAQSKLKSSPRQSKLRSSRFDKIKPLLRSVALPFRKKFFDTFCEPFLFFSFANYAHHGLIKSNRYYAPLLFLFAKSSSILFASLFLFFPFANYAHNTLFNNKEACRFTQATFERYLRD